MTDSAEAKRRKDRVKIPMKRVPAELRVTHTGEVIRARVFLHDISITGISLFTEQRIDVGAKIDIVIEAPKHLFLKVTVASCAEAGNTSHVITTGGTYPFRTGLEIQFQSPEEQAEFKKYCEQLSGLPAPTAPTG